LTQKFEMRAEGLGRNTVDAQMESAADFVVG